MFLPFVLTCLGFAPAVEAPEPRLVGQDVKLTTGTGVLRGTIDLPLGQGPWPIVLLHPGSGPTDRDGNSHLGQGQTIRNDSLKQLGRALAARGIAVLRIDKRGIGGSARAMVKEADLRVETYADDAAAWVAWVRKDPRFTRVGIVGHSEGTLMALLAAKREKVDALVCLCGLGRPLQDVLRIQLKRSLPADLYKEADAIITLLSQGNEVPEQDFSKSLLVLFRASVQPYLISEFRHDPAKILAGLDLPVLVVNGTSDVQVPVEDGKHLAESRKGIALVLIEQMNHVLKETDKKTVLEQLPIYSDPTIPLHPKLADELALFLKTSLGSK